MLKIFFIPLFLIFIIKIKAQINHPYYKYGGDDIEILTLSGDKYNEFFGVDSIEIIGSAILNTNTMKVIGFVEKDTLYSEATLEPEIVSRWLSPDPLAAKYTSLSPYNFVDNSPLIMVDIDGREIFISYEVKNNDGTTQIERIKYTPGMVAYPNNSFLANTISSLNAISTKGDAYNIVETFANDKSSIDISEGKWSDHLSSSLFKLNEGSSIGGTIEWSPNGGVITDDNGRQSANNGLLHELGHFYFRQYDPMGVYAEMPKISDYENREEDFFIDTEKWEKKWNDFAVEKGYDNIDDYWIIENSEFIYSILNNEATRKSHSYKKEFKAINSSSLIEDKSAKKSNENQNKNDEGK